MTTSLCQPWRRALTHSAVLLGTLLLAACATTPPEPTLAMHSAEQAIAAADTSRVADTSSPELAEAREKLASARIAQAKARVVNDEIQTSTQTLALEMQRNAGVR